MLDINDPKFALFGNPETLKDLSALIKRNRVIPFVGAGMSIDIYGSWCSALENIMSGHVFGTDLEDVRTLINKGRYETAAQRIRDLLGEASYYDKLTSVFGASKITDDLLKNMPVRYLPRLFPDALVVTTNFDKVLERVFLMEQHSFEEKLILRHLTDLQAELARRGSPHYLLKIHGCVSAPDEVVMTEESYMDLYQADSKHITRLSNILLGNHLLFIGCGLKEDRTVDLLQKVGLGGQYAILEMNGGYEEAAFQKRRLFMADNLKMHCIWYPKGEHKYVEAILEYLYADYTGQLERIDSFVPEVMTELRINNSLNNEIMPDINNEKSNERNFYFFSPRRLKDLSISSEIEKNKILLNFNDKCDVVLQSSYITKEDSCILKPFVKNEIYAIGHWNNKPLEWLILDVQKNKALLITKDCLMTAPYNEEIKKITWADCTLRNKNLPEIEKHIFNDSERNKILLHKNKSIDNKRYGTPGGADTDDRLFLLNTEETIQYFPYDKARITYLNEKPVWWWLRSPGYSSYGAAIVDDDGSVLGNGYLVDDFSGGVRPVFWLNLDS